MFGWLIATLPALLLSALLIGSWAYCILQVVAARRYRGVHPAMSVHPDSISILKPLDGFDEGLEKNLRTFFEQDYDRFEILFAARRDDDPGLLLARRLSVEYPRVPARFFITGDPPWPNAKVWSLELMMRAARYDLLVMSDSDIRVTPRMLPVIAAEFGDAQLGVATCPYRAVPGHSFWSELEALGMNTEFWGGAFTARLVEGGVHFAVGPTIAARRQAIEAVGGWTRLSGYLAEDFVLGRSAAKAGYGVILSSYIIEHHIGAQTLVANFSHRLRWNRSTRRSRTAGYVGQVFTNPLSPAVLLLLLAPQTWPALALTLVLRAWAAYDVSSLTLNQPLHWRSWMLLPLQDLISFCLWIAGFQGDTILWRGRVYRLLSEGRFELLRP